LGANSSRTYFTQTLLPGVAVTDTSAGWYSVSHK